MEQEFLNMIREALELERDDVALSDHFKEYDEWDSLAQLTLIAQLDETYGVTIETETFRQLVTLSELLEEIKSRIA